MANELACPHGELAPSCEICERDTYIAELRATLFETRNKREFALQQYSQMETRAEQAERELAALKRGEFVCAKCGIRKDSEHAKGDF